MTRQIFKHYPYIIEEEDYKSLRLTREEERSLEYYRVNKKRIGRLVDQIIFDYHNKEKKKIEPVFWNENIKPLLKEEQEYVKKIDELITLSIERSFELEFMNDQHKIFNDAKVKIDEQTKLTVDSILEMDTLKFFYGMLDKQSLFEHYASSLFYKTTRIHWSYCIRHNMSECSDKISEYTMQEATKRFKADYGIDPNCDFSILRYNKYISDLRKPHERMLDYMKSDDNIVSYELEGMTIQFEKHKKLNSSGKRMLIFLLYNFTNYGLLHDRILKFSLTDYMTLCDLKSKNNAVKQIRHGLENLFSLAANINGKEKNQGSFRFRRLISDAGLNINNGFINVEITNLFLELSKTNRVLTLPNQYFRINLLHNPNSPDLLMKISEQKSMNHRSTNNDIITIRTLLEACPNLPKYEEIKAQGRINQRIKDPFFRDLDELSETLTYELNTIDKVKVNVEEAKALPFEEFEELRVFITWNNFPERNKELSKKN